MSERTYLIPKFGPLSGIRVISFGSLAAMPFAGTLMADYGAEVIHLERPEVGDQFRIIGPFSTNDGKRIGNNQVQMARNRLSMEMEVNLNIPESREVFFDLIRQSDIFMENMVWLDKFGIKDEELLAVNPKLVIAHVSGYGNVNFGGLAEYTNRAAYDLIGQAYSGFLFLNGQAPPEGPSPANPYTNDFFSALFCLVGVLVAYIEAQKSGKGQSVDVAQFEAMAACLADTWVSWTSSDVLRERVGGTKVPSTQPYGCYQDKNGDWVAICAFGNVYERFMKTAGLDSTYFKFEEVAQTPAGVSSPKGQELDKAITDWASARTADEIADILAKVKVPCSRVHNAKTALEDPHWISRGDWVKYEDQSIKKEVTAFGIVPKFSRTPGQIWRGAPSLGQDTKDVLTKILKYSPEKIQALRDKKLVGDTAL